MHTERYFLETIGASFCVDFLMVNTGSNHHKGNQ